MGEAHYKSTERKTECESSMTEDKFRHNMCTRKRTYLTRRAAKKIAMKMRKKGSKGARPYKCLFCKNWHNGHPTPSRLDDNGLIIDDI